MTLNEVKALSDEELRLAAGRLRHYPVDELLALGAEMLGVIPAYPYDIAAAWELFVGLPREWSRGVEMRPGGVVAWVHKETGFDMLSDYPGGGGTTYAKYEIMAECPARAITSVFVLVMTRGKP